ALISNVWEVGVDDDITTFRERSQEVGVHSGSRVVFRRAVLRVLVHSVLPAAIVVAAIHVFFFSSRRRHTRSKRDWSSDVGSSDLDRPEDLADELSKPGESYYFNDTKETLRVRVERLYSKTAWSEMPPSRTRHLISNIRVKKDDLSEMEVHSNFIVYRTRMEKDQDIFVGTRKDILRRVNGQIKI